MIDLTSRPLRRPSYRDFLVYLAGPITGLTLEGCTDWRQYVAENVPQEIRTVSPLRAKEPYLRGRGVIEDSFSDFVLGTDDFIVTRDKHDVLNSNVVFFNFLGAKIVSIGTVFELAWAHLAGIPSIVVMEKEGNPHEHCFVRGTADIRVETLDEGITVLSSFLPEGRGTPREIIP